MHVILSYGLGVDSTAILLRWLLEPETRDFDLSDLTVVTAMTGDEWSLSGQLVQRYMLPLMAEHGVRYVQLARTTGSTTEGITILDDSRTPTRLYLEGAYKLSDEMRAAGTLPQRGGTRKCSIHAKGQPLDTFISGVVQGQPFRHVMGFELNEPNRCMRDTEDGAKSKAFPPGTRQAEYPLVEWGWDRQAALDYIAAQFGVEWPKSACTYCPFALSNKASRRATLARFDQSPAEGVQALLMEHLALALNPKQPLIEGGLHGIVSPLVWDAFSRELEATPHTIYQIRRVFRPAKPKPNGEPRYAVSRSVHVLATGSRAHLLDALTRLGTRLGLEVQYDGRDGLHARMWAEERNDDNPVREHMFCLAPAGAKQKQLASFETWWDAAASAEEEAA